MTQGYLIRRTAAGEPCIDQHEINGWCITWNPDDARYYVQRGEATATFKEFRNAVQYARTRKE